MNTIKLEELKSSMLEFGSELSESTCEGLRRGSLSDVIGALVCLLEEVCPEWEDCDSEAPNRAALILGDLKASEAIEPILDVLAHTSRLDLFGEDFRIALSSFGALALEPALQAYDRAIDQEHRHNIAHALSEIQIHDPRILSILLKVLEEDTNHGAWFLSEHGNASALPALSKKLDGIIQLQDNYMSTSARDMARSVVSITDLIVAIETLGGSLTPQQKRFIKHGPAAQTPHNRKCKRSTSSFLRPGVTLKLY